MNTFDIRIRNAAVASLLCAFAAAQALAASANAAKPDFKAYDQNSDGMVSLEEFVSQGGKGKEFLAADVNKDNHLSSDELIEATTTPQTSTPQTPFR